MSNKASPKKHGLVGANLLRPKATPKKRANKAKARVKQTERQIALKAALKGLGK